MKENTCFGEYNKYTIGVDQNMSLLDNWMQREKEKVLEFDFHVACGRVSAKCGAFTSSRPTKNVTLGIQAINCSLLLQTFW